MLDGIRVAAPCKAGWDTMEGSERLRFCSQCDLNVYNLSELTREEAEALVRKSEGKRLCVRFFRRRDGTVITQNCPVGVARRRRFVSLSAALVATLAAAAATATVFAPTRAVRWDAVDQRQRSVAEYEPFKTISAQYPNLIPQPSPTPHIEFLGWLVQTP